MEAILRQTNGLFAVIPATPAGVITGTQLGKIAELVQAGAGVAKLTTGQRLILLVHEDQIEAVREGLAQVDLKIGPVGDCVRNIKGCAGDLCPHSLQNGMADAIALDKEVAGEDMPFSVKISFSGCSRNCMEAQCQDIGLVGTPFGYNIFIGGKGGGKQRHGQLIVENYPVEKVATIVKGILSAYKANARPHERLIRTLDRLGIELFTKHQTS